MSATEEQRLWASQFTCDVHGTMTWETVRTDKCCGVYVPRKGDHCKLLLNRGEPSGEPSQEPAEEPKR